MEVGACELFDCFKNNTSHVLRPLWETLHLRRHRLVTSIFWHTLILAYVWHTYRLFIWNYHHALLWKHYKQQTTDFVGIPCDESQRSSWNSVAKQKSPPFPWWFFLIREIPKLFCCFSRKLQEIVTKCHDSPELFGECLYSESSFLPLLHTKPHSPHSCQGLPRVFRTSSTTCGGANGPSFGRSPFVTFRPAFMATCAVAKHNMQPGSIASIYLMENASPEVHCRLLQKTLHFFKNPSL